MPFVDTPPSYDDAIRREAWTVIAPWIPSSDLCSACLVSRKWHSIFVPFLWGDPASHFGIANDAVYVALTRFKRTLRRARLSVRGLTHTLHLPPALSEIYGGPSSTWLREVLECLPNLQSLIVTKLPFFDHHSLLALRNAGSGRRPVGYDSDQLSQNPFGLKLLLASSEPNTTSAGLVAAVPRFARLVYLDLSYTTAARDGTVLASLSHLYDLQALKLRGIGMRDSEAEILANVIGIRVRLLDLSDNLLTDAAVRSLMEACFVGPPKRFSAMSQLQTARVEDWPAGMPPGPDFFSLDTLRSEDLDHELLKQLTSPLTGRLAFEDLPHRGLTHLYIANNRLTVEGLSSLLKSERLFLLDGGSVERFKVLQRVRSSNSPTGYQDRVTSTGAEILIPVLAQSASKNLTYVRLDHAVVTSRIEELPEQPKSKVLPTELPGSQSIAAELSSESRQIAEAPAPAHFAVELPTQQDPIYEMDATPAQPRAELAGDLMYFAISPPVGEKPQEDGSKFESTGSMKENGVEDIGTMTIQNGDPEQSVHSSDEEPVLNATGSGLSRKRSNEDSTNLTKASSILATPASAYAPRNVLNSDDLPKPLLPEKNQTESYADIPPPLPQRPRQLSWSSKRQVRIDSLMDKRPGSLRISKSKRAGGDAPTSAAKTNLSCLHPAALPHLRTLVLTNVPSKVPKSSPVLDSIKNFISCCADETLLSLLLARTDYSLPPGRARHRAELKHARTFFALRTIILEMEQPRSTKSPISRSWHHSGQKESMGKSSTGDWDSENLWSAAEDDFSFFGEEGEEKDECGIYEHDPDKYFPTAHLDDKIVVDGDHLPPTPTTSRSHQNFSPISPIVRSTTILNSPRNLPLGRNRRSSNEAQRNATGARSAIAELQASGHPLPRLTAISSKGSISPPNEHDQEEQMIDLVTELATWRRERKRAYEEELIRFNSMRTRILADESLPSTSSWPTELEDMPIVTGHWKGDVKVVRNHTPKGRSGVVDVYGNYFEKGYLYP